MSYKRKKKMRWKNNRRLNTDGVKKPHEREKKKTPHDIDATEQKKYLNDFEKKNVHGSK